MGDMMMLTIEAADVAQPSVEWASELLSVPREAFDERFGVILVDPDRGLYAVRVDAGELPPSVQEDERVSGPFSDPRIAPFGHPSPEE